MTIQRVAVDTSVAVRLIVASHLEHECTKRWAAGRELWLTSHSLLETYAVLTRLPGDARLTPQDAVAAIADWFVGVATLPEAEAVKVPAIFAACGISGGAAYDGVVALAARGQNLALATCDARAKGTYAGIGVDIVVVPSES